MTHPLAPLAGYRQFVVVKTVPKVDGRTDKFPMSAAGAVVDAHDAAHWLSWAEAHALATAWGPGYGIGFVLTAADPFWCLDIDGALTAEGWSPLALQLVAALPGCAVEVSQSGRGLHIWGRGQVPPHAKKNTRLHIELYTELRFIMLGSSANGEMAEACPTIAAVAAEYFPPRVAGASVLAEGPVPEWRGPVEDADLLRRALASRSLAAAFGSKAAFADLWDANESVLSRAFPPDASSSSAWDGSSVDMALASHLAFWTGRDMARIERLMRQSKLAREKWDDREDYLEVTIENACSMNRDVCQDKAPAIEHLQQPAPPAAGPGHAAPPATRSKEPELITGSTYLSPAQQIEVFKGCVYVKSLDRVMLPDGSLLKQSQFKAAYGGFSFVMDNENKRTVRNAFEAFTESQAVRFPRADGTCFKPQEPFGALCSYGNRVLVNTYQPTRFPRVAGDITPFMRHMEKLLPNERDRWLVLCFMAAIVQFPGVKFQWTIMLQGVEGNGKTFLSRCVARAVGDEYTHWPKASKLAKQFNAWMVGKIFYAVEDIYTNENVDVIEELKPMITGGDGLEIEGKGVDQVSMEICGNFILNTNHKTGIRKTRNDRRFAVFFTAQQQVEDLARDGMTGSYMHDLYEWARTGGYSHVAHWLATLAIPDDMNPAKGLQRAPVTSATAEAIAASLGSVEQEIVERIEQGDSGFAGGWISTFALARLLDSMRKGAAIPPNRRRDLLRGLGYDYHPGLIEGRVNNPVLPDAGKPRLFIKIGHPDASLTAPAEIAKAYTQAQGIATPK